MTEQKIFIFIDRVNLVLKVKVQCLSKVISGLITNSLEVRKNDLCLGKIEDQGEGQ